MTNANPPRHGEGDRSPSAKGGGGSPRAYRLRPLEYRPPTRAYRLRSNAYRLRKPPSTMRCMVPLPVPGRI
ncbi:MAG: hypothetical protein EOP68_10870 [Sphingomonas sp.]|nr:MAG: hypothetical protein EOP68_10870 [Sphingomonas sp.]